MTEIEEIEVLLKDISKKDKKTLINAWRECINQNYLHLFHNISKKSFETKLEIEDYEEYILDKSISIENRYAKYCRLVLELTKDEISYDEVRKIYKALLLESMSKYDIKIKNTSDSSSNRVYIFTNQYLLSNTHSPSIIINKLVESFRDKVDEIYIISSTPYPHPLPDKDFISLTYSGIEENKLFELSEKTFLIELRGYLSESLYFDFIEKQALKEDDLYILVGDSSLHFDMLPFKRKVSFPTTFKTITWSTSKNVVISEDNNYKNIFDEKMEVIVSSTDFTRSSRKEAFPKKVTLEDNINIAIVGNRLNVELDEAFIEELIVLKNRVKKVKFIIIGLFEKKDMIPLTLFRNIEYLDYEENLYEFFVENIHFYLNPKRKGGGQSAVIALNAGIPVITLPYGDAFQTIHKKYWVKTFNDVETFILNYINDENFKNSIDKYNYEIKKINKQLFESTITNILNVKE